MTSLSEKEFTAAFPAFKTAPAGVVQQILAAATGSSFPAGNRIYAEGDACTAIAFVLSGEIRVFKIGKTGREITLYEIGPGETCILNASCILAKRNYPAHAMTLTAGEMLLVPSALFRRLVEESESMRDFVFSLLSLRLTQVMELVEEIAFGKMDERLMEYLIERTENGKLTATHQKIANDLGTSREVVSRLLKDFERQGRVALARNEITLLTTE